MNLVVIKEKLKEGLDAISRAAGESSQLSVLKNVLLETKKNKLELTATNLELAITYSVLGKIIEEGKTTVSLNLLQNLVNALQSERINLGLKNNILEIKTDNYKAKINGASAEDFPIIPKIKNKTSFIEIDGGLLKEALAQVVIATQFSEIRPELNTILFSCKRDHLLFAATDSFRLAEKNIGEKQFTSTFEDNFTCLIPVKTISELLRITKETAPVKIYKDENQILFETEQWECISRLAEGTFPDYKQIIPKKFEAEIILEREEFGSAVKLTSVLSSRINEVIIKLNETQKAVEIFSSEEAAGENDYILSAKITGKFNPVSFNWKYLTDGLKALKTNEVYFGLNEENKPCELKSPNDPTYFYILMPILKA
jgi:DNA polymerase-3 subunit beta